MKLETILLLGGFGSIAILALFVLFVCGVFNSDDDGSTVSGRMKMRAKRELEQTLWSMIMVPLVNGLSFIFFCIFGLGIIWLLTLTK